MGLWGGMGCEDEEEEGKGEWGGFEGLEKGEKSQWGSDIFLWGLEVRRWLSISPYFLEYYSVQRAWSYLGSGSARTR